MVCPRCIMSVEQLLHEQEITFRSVKLGEVDITGNLNKQQEERLREGLLKSGFELLNDSSSKLVEKIKNILIGKVRKGIEEHFSIQKFISSALFKDYSSVSKLFSTVEGITIEQYFILQKIEKAKELLIYNEMSLAGIAFNLGYSSSQHLSSQFKQVTGMTPTKFKTLGNAGRKPIDNISG